jgi:hypothetical protein
MTSQCSIILSFPLAKLACHLRPVPVIPQEFHHPFKLYQMISLIFVLPIHRAVSQKKPFSFLACANSSVLDNLEIFQRPGVYLLLES